METEPWAETQAGPRQARVPSGARAVGLLGRAVGDTAGRVTPQEAPPLYDAWLGSECA